MTDFCSWWSLITNSLVQLMANLRYTKNNKFLNSLNTSLFSWLEYLQEQNDCYPYWSWSHVICFSISQGGFELPTRLSVAAADCVIALTIALTRKSVLSDFSENKGKSVNRELPNKLTLGRSGASNLKNVKPASISRESSSSTEIGLLLWDLLDEVIVLVQKLSAVCF